MVVSDAVSALNAYKESRACILEELCTEIEVIADDF
jgi:hypothetical protein